ncbi:MAG: aminotransferase class I/II-fold pyridoxal phosphate-dependent enzyme, partial [Actinomycetota bacterium]|nr:aminotransferase class I/II-fold pyridoxal phosphate-dependent enzyme [Actinomycetota bacterium]
AHVEAQRKRYLARLTRLADLLRRLGYRVELPDGAFYLWVPAPDGDAWAAARDLAKRVGVVVSPGEFYGARSAGFFRVAAVAPDERIALAAARTGA